MVIAEALGVVFGYLAVLVFLGWLAKTLVSAWRTPPELRGDWWTAFEQDLHAWASQSASRDIAERRGGDSNP